MSVTRLCGACKHIPFGSYERSRRYRNKKKNRKIGGEGGREKGDHGESLHTIMKRLVKASGATRGIERPRRNSISHSRFIFRLRRDVPNSESALSFFKSCRGGGQSVYRIRASPKWPRWRGKTVCVIRSALHRTASISNWKKRFRSLSLSAFGFRRILFLLAEKSVYGNFV